MAGQTLLEIIDIGKRGNDGTGDTIRQAFKKINANFDQLAPLIGGSFSLKSTQLTDFPDSYSTNQLLITGNINYDRVYAKTLIAGDGINIDFSSNTSITISSDFGASLDTDEVKELVGATNLYFTEARARSSLSSGTGINYDANSGIISIDFTPFTQTDARHSVSAGHGISYSSSTGVISLGFTSGTGISYNSSTGTLSSTITQYTDALARSSLSVIDGGGDGSLTYNSTTGAFTYNGPSPTEVRSHFSAGTGISYNSGTGVISLTATPFTSTDARAAISVTDSGGDGALAYNSSTGVITYTGPSATEVRAHFASGTGINYNSTTGIIAINLTAGNGITISSNMISSSLSAANAGTGYGSLSYNGTTGVLTYNVITDSDIRNRFSSGTGISYNATTGAIAVSLTAGTGISISGATINSTITQYTDTLARASISTATSGTGYGSISYNNTTGIITYNVVTDSDIRNRFSSGTGISYNATTGAISVSLTQGTGISISGATISSSITQYTDALARASISVTDAGGDGAMTYNNVTGVITYTGPSAAESRSHFSGSNGITYNSTSGDFAFTYAPSNTNTATTTALRDANGSLRGTDMYGNSVQTVYNASASGNPLNYISASTIPGIITDDCSGVISGNKVYFLPSLANGAGRIITIINRGMIITIEVKLSDMITTLTTIAPNTIKRLVCDGIAWYVI